MSKKITESMMKGMVEQVLTKEVSEFGTPPKVTDLDSVIDSKISDLRRMKRYQNDTAKKIFKQIADLDGDAENITNEDLKAAYRLLSSGNAGDVEKIAYALKSLSLNADDDQKRKHDVNLFAALSGRAQDPSKTIGAYTDLFHRDPNSITQDDIEEYLFVYSKLPKGYEPNVGDLSVNRAPKQDVFDFDLRNFQAADGAFPDQLASVFEALVGTETNYLKRLQMITNFSKDVSDVLNSEDGDDAAKEKMKSLGLQKFMQNIMALDYITTITKNLESGSAAYQFETFLALLAGGKVTGKAPESEGEDTSLMGATDFEVNVNGQVFKGSSKYFSRFSGLTQSAKGFNVGDKIHYIIAIKKGASDEPQSNPNKIVSLNIHWLVIECFRKNEIGDGKFKYYGPLGNALAVDKEFVSKAQFDSSQFERNSFIGELRLVSVDTTPFKDQATEVADKLSDNFKKVFDLTKSSIADTGTIKDSVSKYSSTGQQADGNEAVSKIVSLKSNVKELIDLLSALEPEQGYETVDTSAIAESKKVSSNLLKKLILETLKK
jgi:hypothetical protein